MSHITYKDSNANVLPSVTDIIKIIQMNDDLLKLANSLGFSRKSFMGMMEDTAGFGTLVHTMIEDDQLRGIAPHEKEEFKTIEYLESVKLMDAYRQYKAYFKDIPVETIAMEKPLVSELLGYGGTLDWLARVRETKILIDIKTAKKIRNTMFLQLGGYYGLLQENKIDIDEAGILQVNDRACLFYPISLSMLKDFRDAFFTLLSFYKTFSPLYNRKYLSRTLG